MNDMASPGTGAGATALSHALLESRERWRDLVALAADMAFETDADGRLVFVSPAQVFGWNAAELLGQPAACLLASHDGWDPFRSDVAARNRRSWLCGPDGTVRCVAVSCAPLGTGGTRGIVQDVSAEEAREASVAAALRRGEVVEHILWQMRQEVLAARMMQAVLEGLVAALGAAGAAVLDLLAPDAADTVLHATGAPVRNMLPALVATLEADTPDASTGTGPAGERILACPSYTRFGGHAGLALWREPDRPWDRDDLLLAGAVTTVVRVVLEHESIQQELARQARTDPLTGLLNRRSFLEEVARRIDRLDREALPGTLLFVDLDCFKQLNDGCGHEVGDEALVLAATLLRNTVRPSDLVARLGGDEFAMWMDAADTFTAAERAESLRVEAPRAFARAMPPGAPVLSMSVGIAMREPCQGEPMAETMRRADEAMYEVKRAGRGHWRASTNA